MEAAASAHSARLSAPAAARARIQSGGGGGGSAAAREWLLLCSAHGSLNRAREAACVYVEASGHSERL